MAPRRGDAGAARHLSGLLALFDLDGTLFLTDDPLSGRALRETLKEVYGIEVAAPAPPRDWHGWRRRASGSPSSRAIRSLSRGPASSGSGLPAFSRRVRARSAARPRSARSCSSSRATAPETGRPTERPRSATHARTSRRRRPSGSSIAVASPRSDLTELAGADALVGDMDGIVEALLALAN